MLVKLPPSGKCIFKYENFQRERRYCFPSSNLVNGLFVGRWRIRGALRSLAAAWAQLPSDAELVQSTRASGKADGGLVELLTRSVFELDLAAVRLWW